MATDMPELQDVPMDMIPCPFCGNGNSDQLEELYFKISGRGFRQRMLCLVCQTTFKIHGAISSYIIEPSRLKKILSSPESRMKLPVGTHPYRTSSVMSIVYERLPRGACGRWQARSVSRRHKPINLGHADDPGFTGGISFSKALGSDRFKEMSLAVERIARENAEIIKALSDKGLPPDPRRKIISWSDEDMEDEDDQDRG